MLFYIADDEVDIHEGLKRVLAKKYPNFQVIEFYDLEDLVDDLRQKKKTATSIMPDVIFLDNMFDKNAFSSGGSTGIDTLPRIRKNAPDIPIILFTATDNYEEVQRIKEFPEIRYLHKPIDETQLYMMVEDIIREHSQIKKYEQVLQENELQIAELRKSLETISNDDEKAKKIYDLMEDVQKKAIVDRKREYSTYLDEMRLLFRQKYNHFDERATKFLATGEFLYHLMNTEKLIDNNIDCSPIAIDYVKCVEYLMQKVLQKKGLVSSTSNKLMLGEAMKYIALTERAWKTNFYEQIDLIRDYRNRTAHQSGLRRNAVDSLRRILFDSQQVKNGEGLLVYFNDELSK